MSYDDLDRLVGVTAGSAQGGNAVFAYDVLDNIRQLDQGTRTVRHTYDGFNRLDTITNAAGTLLSSYNFDTRGNLTSRTTGAVTDTFTFDKANRLLASTVGGVNNTYTYDGLGRRVREFDTASTYFFYGRSGQLLYTNDLKTSLRHNHIYLAGSLVAKRTVPFSGTPISTRYQHTDALGSPVAETNESAVLTRRERMTAYGEPADGTWQAGPGFTGHQMDASSRLVYMQQRYYDPVVGRLLSVDPVATRPMGDNFNRYWYANNNPLKFVDPDGRDVEVRLMAYKIGSAPIQGDYGHQYVHMRDTDSGDEMISRAGPSEPYPGGMSAVVSGSAVGNAAGTGDVTLVTSLTPASVSADSENGAPLGSTVQGSSVTIPGNMEQAAGKLQVFNNDVDSSAIAYKPTSTNSNAYAGTAYTVLTGKDAPSSDFLPGSDVNLVKENHVDKK